MTLKGGAIAPWAKSTSPYYGQTLEALGREYGFKQTERWSALSETARNAILNGTGKTKIEFRYNDGLRSYSTTKTFEGIVPNLERRWKETDSAWSREEIERYMSATPCPRLCRLPAEAGSAGGQGRWASHRRGQRAVDPKRARLVRSAAREADAEAERNRGPDPQGNP